MALHPMRLDPDITPLSQDLLLEIDPDSSGYSGETAIPLRIGTGADSLRLHAEGLTIKTAVLEQNGESLALDAAVRPAGLLSLHAKRPFRAGTATLRIAFTQSFNTQSTSLYKVKVQDRNYVFSQFEAWDARKAFPCFDEPAFKIPWNLTLVVPAGLTALGNYPIASETTDGSRRKIVFARTDPMPSYLMAMAVGEFDRVPIPGMSVPGSVYTVKGQSHLAGFAASMAAPLLHSLEDYFGGRCPYPKLDLIAVPEFMAGAMENPGAITFRESLILLDTTEATTNRKSWLASVMAHEMSHLWFGDLVTMQWWNDLWLNESFASWMGDKTVDKVYPGFKVPVGSVSGRQWAMMLDAMPTARAIRTQILPTDNPSQSFDGLAYDKGQEVLGMLEAWMGEETFRNGIKDYLKLWSWKNAQAGDLWSSLGKAAGKDVDTLMAGFLDQAGVPLVDVAIQGGTIRLKQKRFLLSPRAPVDAREWRIPMVFHCRSGGKDFTADYLLDAPEAEFTPGAGPLTLCHPNQDERGYYRWTLSEAAMDSLAVQAPGFLTERERNAFVGNLGALATAGIMGPDALLQRLIPIASDTSPQVVQSLIGVLEEVDSDLIDSASETDFGAYVSSLLNPLMERIGWEARPGEGELIPDLRSRAFSMLARQGKSEQAGARAQAMAALYLKDPRKVDASLARVALSVSANRGGPGLFHTYRLAFEKAHTPVSRDLLLAALGGFREAGVVDSALDYALHGPLRPHELMSIPRNIASWREHNAAALAWVLGNLEPIIKKRPLDDAAYLPWFAGRSTPEKWALAKAVFLKLDGRVPGIVKEMEKVEAEVDRLAEIRSRDQARVRVYLRQFKSAASGKG